MWTLARQSTTRSAISRPRPNFFEYAPGTDAGRALDFMPGVMTIEILETLALPWAVLILGEKYTVDTSQGRALCQAGLAREIPTEKNLEKITTKKGAKNVN